MHNVFFVRSQVQPHPPCRSYELKYILVDDCFFVSQIFVPTSKNLQKHQITLKMILNKVSNTNKLNVNTTKTQVWMQLFELNRLLMIKNKGKVHQINTLQIKSSFIRESGKKKTFQECFCHCGAFVFTD